MTSLLIRESTERTRGRIGSLAGRPSMKITEPFSAPAVPPDTDASKNFADGHDAWSRRPTSMAVSMSIVELESFSSAERTQANGLSPYLSLPVHEYFPREVGCNYSSLGCQVNCPDVRRLWHNGLDDRLFIIIQSENDVATRERRKKNGSTEFSATCLELLQTTICLWCPNSDLNRSRTAGTTSYTKSVVEGGSLRAK
jgi:hypothetical protein